MKISTSSSMLLATLAVSSSNPCLAAPTGDVPDSGLASSSSNAHIASRRSSVSYPQPETSDLERRGGAVCDLLEKIETALPAPLALVSSLVAGVVNPLLGCSPDPSLKTLLTPEQLAAVDNFAQVVAAAAQSPQTSDHLSPSSDTPPAPPNTPDVSSQPAQTPVAQRREPHFFARRGVGAPPASPPSGPATPPAAPNPVAVAGQPAAAVPSVPGVPNSVPSVGNNQSPLPAAAPPSTNPTDASSQPPHPQPPVDSKAQAPPPTRRAWSSRALPKTSDVRPLLPPGVPQPHPQTQVNMDPLHSRDLPHAPTTPPNLPASSPQVPGAPVPQSASGLPANPVAASPPGIPAVPQAASPPGGIPAVPQAASPAPVVPAQQPVGTMPQAQKIVPQPQIPSRRRSEPEADDEDCDDEEE